MGLAPCGFTDLLTSNKLDDSLNFSVKHLKAVFVS